MARALTASVLFLLLLKNTALGCLWFYGTSNEGERVMKVGHDEAYLLRNALTSNLAGRGDEMARRNKNGKTLQERNDYAVGLIYMAKYDEGIRVLQELENETPGEYYTAANLGTAYELVGKNEEALHWIEEGIRRNPQSHMRSEWIHAAILQAKLAMQADPGYLDTHRVLDIQPLLNTMKGTIRTSGGEEVGLERVRRAISYQLGERLQFVRSNDVICAQLLFDLARLQERAVTLESANQIYKLAQHFGYPSTKTLPLIQANESRIKKAERRRLFWKVFGVACGMVATGWLVRRWFYRRRA